MQSFEKENIHCDGKEKTENALQKTILTLMEQELTTKKAVNAIFGLL